MSSVDMPRTKRLLLALTALASIAAVNAATATASTTQDALFQENSSLRSDPSGTLATLQSLGASRIRLLLYWNEVAPASDSRRKPAHFNASDPAAYPAANWARYDTIIKDAQADGIAVDLNLVGPAPLWATGTDVPKGGAAGPWKPSAREFGSFVKAAGTRYDGHHGFPRVSFFSIWNEPNYGPSLAPQATNHDTVEVGAGEYRGLVDAGWSSLQASGHGRDTILIGETAPRGLDHPIGNYSGTKPLRFLRALYCVDGNYRPLTGSAARARGCPTTASASRKFRSQHPALFNASGYADHPYAQGFSPVTMTYACGRGNRSVCGSSRRSDPDYTDFAVLPRLERTLDRLNGAYGSRRQFPIFSTEYGYWTNPPDKAATINPATAAMYMNWAEYLSYKQPRIRSYAQYLLVDPPLSNFASGLEFFGGAHKVTYDAYRLPLFLPNASGRKGSPLEVWGAVRPAHFAGGQQMAQIEFQAGSRGAFTTLQTVPITNVRGYFDTKVTFPASGSVRLTWTDPLDGAVHSRTVKVTVR